MITKEEQEFLDLMHKFPLGYVNDNLHVGKWFEDKDLLESVKELYSLKDKLLDKKNK